jgi:hypothetical protein
MSTITDSEFLHRRIHPTQMKEGRPSSAAFTDPEMSVDRAALRTVDETLRGYGSYGVAGFSAGFARGLEQEVIPDPALLNQSHALVKGHKPRATSKRFARECTLVRAPHAPLNPPEPHVSSVQTPGSIADL